MFLRECIKYTCCVCRSLPMRSMKYLLICGLLLQACAVTKTETRIVPGKELSKTSLGLREIENKNVLKEINPYSVSISRKVCEAELFRMEYKGMREMLHKRQELYCAGAYPEYIAFQLTTFGIPFVYDLVSGFGIFRDMCDKGPQKISTDVRETNATVTEEMTDFNTICRDVPISGVEVTAEIDNNISKLVSSTTGVAALTPELISSIERLDRDVYVSYKYMSETIKTTIKQAARPAILVVNADHQDTAKNSIKKHDAAGGDNPEAERNDTVGKASINVDAARQNVPVESQIMVKGYDQNPTVQKNKDLTDATAGEVSKFLQGAPVEGQNVSVKNSGNATIVNQGQQEAKTYMSPRIPAGLNKDELPNLPAENENKPGHTLFKVEFAYNRADVKQESLGVLKMFAEAMKSNPNMVSIVEGHTDNLGSADVNRKMSFRRASAVRDVFVNRYGIAAKRIRIYGYGLTRPIADNNVAEGRAKNRRTEIYTAESDDGL